MSVPFPHVDPKFCRLQRLERLFRAEKSGLCVAAVLTSPRLRSERRFRATHDSWVVIVTVNAFPQREWRLPTTHAGHISRGPASFRTGTPSHSTPSRSALAPIMIN